MVLNFYDFLDAVLSNIKFWTYTNIMCQRTYENYESFKSYGGGKEHSYEIHFVNYTNEPLLKKNNKDKSCKLNNRGIFKQQSQLT